MVDPAPVLLYCRCAYAQVLPTQAKDAVLHGLCASEQSFEAVADLCEMAAHRDPRLATLAATAAERGLRISACHERAVRGLFIQCGHPLPPSAEVINLRELTAPAALARLLRPGGDESVSEVA
jgi:hypothetical protein